jgi:hypothetical protein
MILLDIYQLIRKVEKNFVSPRQVMLPLAIPLFATYCLTPEEKASRTPFGGACPDFGFIQESDIPESAIIKFEDVYGRRLESLDRVVMRTGGNLNLIIEDKRALTSALNYYGGKYGDRTEIDDVREYEEFKKTFDKVCPRMNSSNADKLLYSRKKQNELIRKESAAFHKLFPIDKIFDLRDEDNKENFKNAWFNRFVSPSVNNYFQGNQFEYESKKEEWHMIRNRKILLSSSDEIELGDYDFQKQCFFVKSLSTGVPSIDYFIKVHTPNRSVSWTRAVIYDEGHAVGNLCLPVEKDAAENLYNLSKARKLEWSYLWEIENLTDAPSLESCDFENYYIDAQCKKDGWKRIKIRGFQLKLLAFLVTDQSGDYFLEGKVK